MSVPDPDTISQLLKVRKNILAQQNQAVSPDIKSNSNSIKSSSSYELSSIELDDLSKFMDTLQTYAFVYQSFLQGLYNKQNIPQQYITIELTDMFA